MPTEAFELILKTVAVVALFCSVWVIGIHISRDIHEADSYVSEKISPTKRAELTINFRLQSTDAWYVRERLTTCVNWYFHMIAIVSFGVMIYFLAVGIYYNVLSPTAEQWADRNVVGAAEAAKPWLEVLAILIGALVMVTTSRFVFLTIRAREDFLKDKPIPKPK